jgi:hypothetical protein
VNFALQHGLTLPTWYQPFADADKEACLTRREAERHYAGGPGSLRHCVLTSRLQGNDASASLPYDTAMQREFEPDPPLSPFFVPSRRETVILVALVAATLALALFLRYSIIQNSTIGLACEAGEDSFTCTIRLAVILLFVRNMFGWAALIAAVVQLWRPNIVTFGVSLISIAFGIVLYNTRLSALAIALLVLSLARMPSEAR